MVNEYTVREFLLLSYKAFGGNIRGKTMLQKRIYFLSVMLDVDLGYGAHFYGPYSSAVAAANQDLKTLGYLEESSAGWGFDHRGFEVARYDYALSDDGKVTAELRAERHSELWRNIEAAASVIQEAGDLSYMELSVAAKAYFALTRKLKGRATLEELSGLMPQFGWTVDKDELKRASAFLERAHLVEKR